MIALLDRVYAVLGTQREVTRGQNIVIYSAGGGIEAGVEVGSGFRAGDGVDLSATPSGRAATATHVGPYNKLGETHASVRAWCRSSGENVTAVSWEVYGDWDDDESRLLTQVYVLLAP